MTAKEAISAIKRPEDPSPERVVGSSRPLLEVLPLLLDTAGGRLGVEENGEILGVIDAESMLGALGRQIAARDDCSVIELECAPGDYSASRIAHAVEDVDVHLVDILSRPGDNGRLRVTLRIRCEDPLPAVHSLERYGYSVVSDYGNSGDVDHDAAIERLLGLQALINV